MQKCFERHVFEKCCFCTVDGYNSVCGIEGFVGHLHWMKMTPPALFVSSFVAPVQPQHHVSFSLHSNVRKMSLIYALDILMYSCRFCS